MARPIEHGKKWRIRWVDETGKRRSAVFDEYRTAQTELSRRLVEVDEIKRGLRRATPASKTFNELCDYWLDVRAPRKRSRKHDKSIITRHLRPAFGSSLLRDIGVEDGDTYSNEKIDGLELAEKTVGNHLTLLQTMMTAATEFKTPWLLSAPKFRKPKVALFSRDYQWLRNEAELRRLLDAALTEEGEQVFVFYATAVFTGMRAGELAALEWSDISLERRLITVQRSFHGPTKTNRIRHVPILDPLLPILRQWRLRHPGKLVFTNMLGNMFAPSSRIFQEILHRVLDTASFPKVTRHDKERSYIRFHDLRHTFASHWVMNGGDLFRLQKVLGHQSIAMTLRYAHLAPEAFKDDYGRLGSAVFTGATEVVALPARVTAGAAGGE